MIQICSTLPMKYIILLILQFNFIYWKCTDFYTLYTEKCIDPLIKILFDPQSFLLSCLYHREQDQRWALVLSVWCKVYTLCNIKLAWLHMQCFSSMKTGKKINKHQDCMISPLEEIMRPAKDVLTRPRAMWATQFV